MSNIASRYDCHAARYSASGEYPGELADCYAGNRPNRWRSSEPLKREMTNRSKDIKGQHLLLHSRYVSNILERDRFIAVHFMA